MPELKTKSIAIIYNKDGTCKRVATCTHIKEKEYGKLVEEMRISEAQEYQVIKEILNELHYCKEQIKHLLDEIKVLKGEDENE